MFNTQFEGTTVHKKIENLKVKAYTMETVDYGYFIAGLLSIGTIDVLHNFGHVWPCVGDIANIGKSGFDFAKYINQY